jgi:hypothetical protein
LLHAAVPGFSAVRFPVRLLSLARFGGALLVALGIERLGRPTRFATALRAAALGGLLLARMTEAGAAGVRPAALGTTPSPVYRALASSAEQGALLELPMGGGGAPRGPYRETAYMLASTVHWKPLINGYSGYAPPTYDLLAGAARRLPEPDALQELVDMAGLRWVIVHAGPGPMREAWRPLLQAGTVRVLAEEPQAVLLVVDLPARRDLVGALRDAVLRRPTTTLVGTPLAPLPPGALRASVTVPRLAQPLRAGAPLRFRPLVRNEGDAVWPGLGVWPDGLVVVDVRWLNDAGAAAGGEVRALRLPRDLAPGESAVVEAILTTPRQAGSYRLEVVVRQAGQEAESVAASLNVAVAR